MNRNLCKKVITEGGELFPLIIPSNETNGTGLMNPSIFNDNGNLLLNIRHVNYTLYHSEGGQLFENRFGPLAYLHPENDIHLRTNNFMCELNEKLLISGYSKVDTSKLDVEPIWEFVGLEDARVVRWDNKLYMCGVRRDTTTNGVGRMELSEVVIINNKYTEINRYRIEPPNDPNSYCEKNWMPIIDMPFHFVKWTNPTEVVKVDIQTLTSKTVFLSEKRTDNIPDLRGGSQVIRWKNYRICVVHDVNLFKNKKMQKDAVYMHRIVVWDKNWNIVKITQPFSFMTGEIEFCCGMALYNEDLLITFGFQDNAAYMLKIPSNIIKYLLELEDVNINLDEEDWNTTEYPTLEITTSIPEKGCVVDCVFCPQRVLSKSYNGEKMMSLDNFKKVIDKLPKEITITFAGFIEPWLNNDCTNMLIYAHETGHQISVFTTAVGMSIKDVELIKDIPFSNGPNGGFVLHLPDNEGFSKHPITKKYIEVLEYIKSISTNIPNFKLISMGTVHDDVKHIFPTANVQEMWSRAGNLTKELELKPELLSLKDKFKSRDNGDQPITCGCIEKLYHNVLLPNGDVSLCCMDYDLSHILGNLYNQEYSDIIPEPNTSFDLCRFCENGIKK